VYPPQQYPPQQPGFGDRTLHGEPEPPSRPAVAATRAALLQAQRGARLVTRKVITASKADGAEQSGLTALIWNQVLSYGTDAMITVALAGTVFFGASAHAQRGNVLLYLLVTMAPFAVVAPVIGPALDRFQHGRRWAMAGTAVGRAVLALIMASHSSELFVLYPCALGSLVLSKAYSVLRASAAPRLVPPGLTLTEANARLSLFGLGSTLISGATIGILIKLTGSYSFGLIVTAAAFGVCAFFALRLPPQVDSPAVAGGPRQAPHPPTAPGGPALARIRTWATRGFTDLAVLALQGESVLRFLSGLLTIYLAFYVERTTHGITAALQLGFIVVAAAGVGNAAGTLIGTRLRLNRPEFVIVMSVGIAAATSLLVAVVFTIPLAGVGMLASAVANSLSKIALDSLIQRDVAEGQRSSAFARSETFLQLAWVAGAAVGVVLPTNHGGWVGYTAAAIVVGTVAVVVGLRFRVLARAPRGAEGFA
jgi:MFS family permease